MPSVDKPEGKGKDQKQVGCCRQKRQQGEYAVLHSKSQEDQKYI